MHDNSLEAYASVKPVINRLQQDVLNIIALNGPLTAHQVARHPDMSHYSYPTARARVSELSHAGLLETVGTDRSQRLPSAIHGLTRAGVSALAEARSTTGY